MELAVLLPTAGLQRNGKRSSNLLIAFCIRFLNGCQLCLHLPLEGIKLLVDLCTVCQQGILDAFLYHTEALELFCGPAGDLLLDAVPLVLRGTL